LALPPNEVLIDNCVVDEAQSRHDLDHVTANPRESRGTEGGG
jgi:hypothetical protein